MVPENIHTPPWRELEILKGWEVRGSGGDSLFKGLISNSVRKLLLTDVVYHFLKTQISATILFKQEDPFAPGNFVVKCSWKLVGRFLVTVML